MGMAFPEPCLHGLLHRKKSGAYAAPHNRQSRRRHAGTAMYTMNDQFAKASRQFADNAAQANRLLLQNAENAFALQLATPRRKRQRRLRLHR